VPTFPDDFIDRDGRFRAVVQPEFAPVVYVTTNGSYICANCLNTACIVPHDPDAPSDPRMPVGYELLTFGPEICCEHCSRAVAPLYRQDESF